MLDTEIMNYNIPSNNRELQPKAVLVMDMPDYNIPSNNRELQRCNKIVIDPENYNIPSNNRELQPLSDWFTLWRIITYQVITGNYSDRPDRYHAS